MPTLSNMDVMGPKFQLVQIFHMASGILEMIEMMIFFMWLKQYHRWLFFKIIPNW